MNKPYLSTILQLRLLVGYLGEKTQFGWWSTSFYGDYSLRSLEFVTPKTAGLAQYHGVLEAARILHDEHLNLGCYHLFRLPEEVEQDVHAIIQSTEVKDFSSQIPKSKNEALDALETLASITVRPNTNFGPTAIGNINDLHSADTFEFIARAYHSAFLQNTKIYPYLLR